MGRHVVVIVLSAVATYLLLESRAEWAAMHRWNRAVGDVGLLLITVAMAIGPLARLFAPVRAALPWRRELGIYGVVLAGVHTAIVLDGWVTWDFARLFGYEFHPALKQYVMVQHGFALANIIGFVALGYGAILAATSNDVSQRRLGGSVWKFIQQGAYVLWALIVLHTAYFLYLHFQDFHRRTPEPNWLQLPFAILIVTVAGLQLFASIRTWRGSRRSRRRRGLAADATVRSARSAFQPGK
jgi:sulfoxide reductase heme-binding subunit YedZ